MTEHITTNIRLPKDLYRQAKRRALEEEKSLAQLIRESVAQYLTATTETETGPKMWENDPLWLIGTDGTVADVTDASMRHDDYLYGPLSDEARAETKD